MLPAERVHTIAVEWIRGNAVRVTLVAAAFLAILRALWVVAQRAA
jgi:hypothetical protein